MLNVSGYYKETEESEEFYFYFRDRVPYLVPKKQQCKKAGRNNVNGK